MCYHCGFCVFLFCCGGLLLLFVWFLSAVIEYNNREFLIYEF